MFFMALSGQFSNRTDKKQGLNKLHCESTGVQELKGDAGFTIETVGALTCECQKEKFRCQEYVSKAHVLKLVAAYP